MKKQILKLGKALNKAEQRLVKGGSIFPIDGDDICEQLTENDYNPDCPCWIDSQCINMAVPASDGIGYTIRSGTCIAGVCVV